MRLALRPAFMGRMQRCTESGVAPPQRVPKAADLAPPAPAALVQPLPPPDDLEAVDPKWFGFLEDGAPACWA